MRPGVQPVPILVLTADTGGGHRAAARAISQALRDNHPGRFTPIVRDPLTGPDAPGLSRWTMRGYGPLTRRAPWLWGVLYHATNSGAAQRVLHRATSRVLAESIATTVAADQPGLIVSVHPLLGRAAVTAAAGIPVVTVITDLVTAHRSWRYERVDRIVAPSAEIASRCQADRCTVIGLPVLPEFHCQPTDIDDRVALRDRLGVPADRFVVLLTGGGEGSGGIGARARAILRALPEVAVVAICGRNRALAAKLDQLAVASAGRLLVTGFVPNMADWLRCADVVVTKAGPGTIAEATACGAALLLTAHLPGQERGNTEFVVNAGAGRRAYRISDMVRELDRLRADPVALDAMRAASARLGRPRAAAEIADLIAELAGQPRPGQPRPGQLSA